MSVPTETKPPSLVRRSLICSQRPSSSCSSKLRAPSSGRPSDDDLGADQRLPAGGDHVGIGRAGHQRRVRHAVELLVLRIAHDEAVVGVPQDEGLGDRLDRVAEADVGGLGALDQAHLLGDVDGDADEVRLAGSRGRPARRGRGARSSGRRRGACGTCGRPWLRPCRRATRRAPSGRRRRGGSCRATSPKPSRSSRGSWPRSRTSSATRTSGRARGPSPTGRSGRASAPSRSARASPNRSRSASIARRRLGEIAVEDDEQDGAGADEDGDVERDVRPPVVEDVRHRHDHGHGAGAAGDVVDRGERRRLVGKRDLEHAGALRRRW